MQRINLAWFSQLGVALQPLGVGGLEEPVSAQRNLQRIAPYLYYLADPARIPLALDASRPVIWEILEASNELFEEGSAGQRDIVEDVKNKLYELFSRLSILGC